MTREDFTKYHKIKHIGHADIINFFLDEGASVVVQEKIDGANFRFMILNGNIVFGSRSRQITTDEGQDIDIEKAFRRAIQFVRHQTKDIDLSKLEGLIFFGENCVQHSIPYNWDTIPPFLGFDVYDIKNETYLPFKKVQEYYKTLSLPMVPLLYECTIGELPKEISDDFIPISKYAPTEHPSMKAEGVVFKNYDTQEYVKYVRQSFKEENKKAFGTSKKFILGQHQDTERFVAQYCTNARIDKIIFKTLDDGEELQLKLMSIVPREVSKDILSETFEELGKGQLCINFPLFRKLISKRCLAVLQQMITNANLK